MLCTRFVREARRGLAILATLLVAILALPSTASANAHHQEHPSQPAAASSERDTAPARSRPSVLARSWTAVVRFGAGYARPDGSQRVRSIQRRLRDLGYAPGPIDGRFGPLTERSVRRFQAAHRLARDGAVGAITYTHLRQAKMVVRLGAGYVRPQGSRRVRSIQRRLREVGYARGPVDGRFGPLTERAVKRFQAAHRLAADGAVGPNTLRRLRLHAAGSPSTTGRAVAPGVSRPSVSPVPQAVRPPTAQRPAPYPASPPGQAVEAVLVALGLIGLAVFVGSYVRTRTRLARGTSVRRGPLVTEHNKERVR
jgi:peptidoglycan hydrolase-like protein with peptidoglycan-binding domain